MGSTLHTFSPERPAPHGRPAARPRLLADRLRHSDPYVHYNDLIYEIPCLYHLAGDKNFFPMPFIKKGETIGYMVPATVLHAWSMGHPQEKKKISFAFNGMRDSHAFYASAPAPAAGEKSSRIILTGTRKNETRLLTVVSPALFSVMHRFPAPPERVQKNQESVSENFPDPSIIYYTNTGQIAEICALNKPAFLTHHKWVAAVPGWVGREIAQKHLSNAPDNFIVSISSKEYSQQKTWLSDAQKNKRFLSVATSRRGPGAKEWNEAFMIVPRHYLAWLDFNKDGSIQGVKGVEELTLRFNVSAEIKARGMRADIHVDPETMPALLRSTFLNMEGGAHDRSKTLFRHRMMPAPAVFSSVIQINGTIRDISVSFGENAGTASLHQIVTDLAPEKILHFGGSAAEFRL